MLAGQGPIWNNHGPSAFVRTTGFAPGRIDLAIGINRSFAAGTSLPVIRHVRWSTRGASAILGLRCEEASGRWSEIIWANINTQTSVA